MLTVGYSARDHNLGLRVLVHDTQMFHGCYVYNALVNVAPSVAYREAVARLCTSYTNINMPPFPFAICTPGIQPQIMYNDYAITSMLTCTHHREF